MLTFATFVSCAPAVEAPQDGTPGAPEPVLVVNRGVGGHTSKDGLARYARDVIEVKPDHLVLYFGINDACNSRKLVPVDTFRANLQEMIDRSPCRSIVLVTPNPVMGEYLADRHPTHPQKHDFQGHLDTYDAAVRDLARKNGLAVADLRKMVAEHGHPAGSSTSLIRNERNGGGRDGVHLTARGYEQMAAAIAAILQDRIKPGDVVVCMGDSITYGSHMAGAGTAYGDTYPAWLSLFLNRSLGLANATRPPPPPPDDPTNLVRNGGFEDSADRIHADHWGVWNVAGRQQGELELRTAPNEARSGRRYLRVHNQADSASAFVTSPLARIGAKGRHALTFWMRGTGTLRPLLNRRRGRTGIDAFPPAKDNPWRQAADSWTQHTLTYEPEDDITMLGVAFRVTGHVDIDDVSLRRSEP